VDHESTLIRFIATPEQGEVSGLLDRSVSSRALMVLGHGSGSTMHVPFIAGLSKALVERGIATFRYQFPFSEAEDFVPYTDMDMNEPEVMAATVRAAIAAAALHSPDLPLFAGGHSVSARLTSEADSQSRVVNLQGIILLAFPLKGDMSRAAHFAEVSTPLLFIQGSGDPYADIDEMRAVVAGIGVASELRVIEDADHGFSVPDRNDVDVLQQIAEIVSDWMLHRIG
jgi:predicted alpha/beta-hydrolase family hydrolase